MSFAALEARANASVLKHLSNVLATVGGRSVSGIFDRAYDKSAGGIGMSGTAPMFRLATTDVPLDPVGQLLVINGVTYAIAEHEPDSTGLSMLLLERT